MIADQLLELKLDTDDIRYEFCISYYSHFILFSFTFYVCLISSKSVQPPKSFQEFKQSIFSSYIKSHYKKSLQKNSSVC